MTSHPAKVGNTVRTSVPRNITTRLPRKCAEVTAQLRAELAAKGVGR